MFPTWKFTPLSKSASFIFQHPSGDIDICNIETHCKLVILIFVISPCIGSMYGIFTHIWLMLMIVNICIHTLILWDRNYGFCYGTKKWSYANPKESWWNKNMIYIDLLDFLSVYKDIDLQWNWHQPIGCSICEGPKGLQWSKSTLLKMIEQKHSNQSFPTKFSHSYA